ncbi:MAG: hypothetical protein ACRDXC_02345 [Acidimicrobiales bacterium]
MTYLTYLVPLCILGAIVAIVPLLVGMVLQYRAESKGETASPAKIAELNIRETRRDIEDRFSKSA